MACYQILHSFQSVKMAAKCAFSSSSLQQLPYGARSNTYIVEWKYNVGLIRDMVIHDRDGEIGNADLVSEGSDNKGG